MFIRLGSVVVNTNTIETFDESQITFISNSQPMSLKDGEYEIITGILFPVVDEKSSDDLTEYFNELHKLVGGTGSALLTTKRRAQLNKLLNKEGFTRESLKIAASNIGNDEWLQGANDNNKRYGTIDYLLRPEKAAEWLEKVPDKKKSMF